MKIMFMGTPEFALPCLRALIKEHEVVCVVTREDKPKGRKMQMTQTPVKEEALAQNIPVLTPKTLKNEEFYNELLKYSPELIVVVAFGLILPKNVLDFPKYGCINVHGSLLPKYRGAAPMQRSIIDGEEKTGITIMEMEEGLDAGDMLKKAEIEIDYDMDFERLHDKMSELGAELLLDTILEIKNGTARPKKQDDSLASYAHMITKETAKLDFSLENYKVRNLVRGLHPFPAAWCMLSDKKLKILKCELSNENGKPGEIIKKDDESFTVACGEGSIRVLEIQLEGKKRMTVKEFFRGNSILNGEILL